MIICFPLAVSVKNVFQGTAAKKETCFAVFLLCGAGSHQLIDKFISDFIRKRFSACNLIAFFKHFSHHNSWIKKDFLQHWLLESSFFSTTLLKSKVKTV
jgi:hypothetical protein